MLIYRVEDDDGLGMYADDMLNNAARVSDRHPMPASDGRLMDAGWLEFQSEHSSDVRFGFGSLEQLRFWLYRQSWRNHLTDEGYRVHVYDVPDGFGLIGDTQAVFALANAKHCRAFELA